MAHDCHGPVSYTHLDVYKRQGPNKGIEYAIAAMEKVAAKFPEVLYIVLGATHPCLLYTSRCV